MLFAGDFEKQTPSTLLSTMAAISDEYEEDVYSIPDNYACSEKDVKRMGHRYLQKLMTAGDILGELGRRNQWDFVTFAFDDTDYTGMLFTSPYRLTMLYSRTGFLLARLALSA